MIGSTVLERVVREGISEKGMFRQESESNETKYKNCWVQGSESSEIQNMKNIQTNEFKGKQEVVCMCR